MVVLVAGSCALAALLRPVLDRIGDFSLADTRIGMILVYCTFNLPFAIWTLRPTLDGIPKELDEAAYVDGAASCLRRVIRP
ncbi:hypothetical protein [Paracoccus mutanolyticus]|uniref:hypothetical protein n=1 Tax=Paracoccus mutanolyticus TaxID=1499308 RepID=UPI001CB8B70D|nr:hypothetical protein [Paracoccus mutanolyticus]